jgi:hypothetical protein
VSYVAASSSTSSRATDLRTHKLPVGPPRSIRSARRRPHDLSNHRLAVLSRQKASAQFHRPRQHSSEFSPRPRIPRRKDMFGAALHCTRKSEACLFSTCTCGAVHHSERVRPSPLAQSVVQPKVVHGLRATSTRSLSPPLRLHRTFALPCIELQNWSWDWNWCGSIEVGRVDGRVQAARCCSGPPE